MFDYKEILEGVGKLKDYQFMLHVDLDIPPLGYPVRRTPFSLKRIDQLVAYLTRHNLSHC